MQSSRDLPPDPVDAPDPASVCAFAAYGVPSPRGTQGTGPRGAYVPYAVGYGFQCSRGAGTTWSTGVPEPWPSTSPWAARSWRIADSAAVASPVPMASTTLMC